MEVFVLHTWYNRDNAVIEGVYDNEDSAQAAGIQIARETQRDWSVTKKSVLSKEEVDNNNLASWLENCSTTCRTAVFILSGVEEVLKAARRESFESTEDWNARIRRAIFQVREADFAEVIAAVRNINNFTDSAYESI